jgi:hypothetical protein
MARTLKTVSLAARHYSIPVQQKAHDTAVAIASVSMLIGARAFAIGRRHRAERASGARPPATLHVLRAAPGEADSPIIRPDLGSGDDGPDLAS